MRHVVPVLKKGKGLGEPGYPWQRRPILEQIGVVASPMWAMPLVWVVLFGFFGAIVTNTPMAKASSWIGLQGGQPFIHLGYVDPALPPVVVTGGSQLLVVSPEESWSLTMEALGDLVNQMEPDVTIPISRLAWALHDDQPPRWTPLQAREPVVILASKAPTSAPGQSVQVDYKFSPSFDDQPLPSQYATDLRFTLSSNLELLQSWVYPTPFRADGLDLLTIGFWLPGVGVQQLELTITDSDGAVVRRSRISQLGGEWRNVAWTGLLESGEFAAPGLYHYQIIRLPQREPIAAGLIQVAHDDKPPGSSSIRGKITKADVGYGAVGAQVVLYTKKRRQVATAFTEPNGMYEFGGLPEGEYYIEASLPGYTMAQTGVLHLGSGAVQEVNLALLPNRALDLDIQLLTKSVAVGDVLEANVRITNSGTRDLLDTVVTLAVPVGFAYGGSDVNHGILEVADAGISLYEIRWTTGFLKQGESLRAKMWFVVGLDAPRRNGNIRGQALGFAASEKVVTPTISRELEVMAGPFIATSPHSQMDGHVALPVGETGLLEVLLQPKGVLGGPILPFQETEVTKYVERSDLVPLSQPVEFEDGLLAGHALRMRLDGKSFVTEGGLWHHTIGGWGLPSSDVSIVGVKAGAKLDDDSILRSFYGLPKSWPMYSLHPADNTSGPFQLPKAPVPWGKIDVKIVSWDATREMWQEEGPVLFRIDHATGDLTLGRAIGAFNTLGDRQYILVIYEGQELGLELSWREISLALNRPNWGLVAGYLETGDEGRIKLVTLGGRLVEDRFRLQANLRTLLGEKPRLGLNPWDTHRLSEGQEDVVSGNTNSDQVKADGGQGQIDARNGNGRSAWQIIGALEPHPKTRVGGGWSMDSGHLGDFWGLTTPYDGRQGGTDSLTTLGHDGRGEEVLDELVLRLEGELVRERRGMSPGALLKPLPAGKHWVRVLAGEVDLGSGLVASLVTGKSSLLISQDQSPSQREQNIAKGWEQSFIYKGQDWPIWSLGYGQRETGFDPSLEKDKSHYGFLAVDGQMEHMEWGAKLTLSQSRTPRGPVNTNPIRATADLRAQYEVGGLRPYVRGSHQVARDRLGASQGESQEDWTVGLEGQISDQLRVDVAHNQKQDGRSTKEQLALQAAYEFSTGWSLLGTCQWPIGQSKDEFFPWQGTIGLRGEIGLAHVLDVGWGRSFRQGITTDTVSIDEISVGVRAKRSQGVFPYSEIKLNSRLHDGRWTAWELQGEGGWRLGSSWEAWTYGGYKQVIHGKMDPVTTRQGVVRLSRRLGEKLAGFGQVGAWRQLQRGELGYSFGVSYNISPKMALAVGHTWADVQRAKDTGFLSVRPGFFVQLFAR